MSGSPTNMIQLQLHDLDPAVLLHALQTHPRLQEVAGPREHGADTTQNDFHWVVVLTKYHRDNLLQLLNAVGWPLKEKSDPALWRYNTGDWNGEIPWMLRKKGRHDAPTLDPDDRPNALLPERR